MFTAFYHLIIKRSGPFLLLLLVPLLAICSCGGSDSSAPYANTIAQMTTSIQKQLADSGVTGGVSIALVDDQKVAWTQSFGYADAGTRTLATPDTTYRIASITKTFTGTMVMQLSDQGLLDVSDPLTRFIPTFRSSLPSVLPQAGRSPSVRS